MKKVRNIIMGLLLILPFSLNAAPQLVLSFDGGYNGGTSIEETWRDYRHIFEQYPDVKVTFFVGRYTDFYMGTPMVDFLRDMKAAGHRIAMHGTKHLRAEDFVALHGIQGYVKVEILPDLVNLRADGFDIEHFAYGFGSFTRETDVVLSQYFKTLRYVAGGASIIQSD